MNNRQIFHLSVRVCDLGSAKEFYFSVLQGVPGRHTDLWADVLVWGHQITK
jgi:extradiol dioxygenase family protein